MEQAVVGENEIVGGEGRAVGPFAVRAEVEGPLGEVLVVLPGGRGARRVGVVFLGIVRDQPLEQGADDVALDHPGDEVRVERFGVAGIPDDQDLFAVRLLDLGFALAAGEAEQGGEQEKGAACHGRRED